MAFVNLDYILRHFGFGKLEYLYFYGGIWYLKVFEFNFVGIVDFDMFGFIMGIQLIIVRVIIAKIHLVEWFFNYIEGIGHLLLDNIKVGYCYWIN